MQLNILLKEGLDKQATRLGKGITHQAIGQPVIPPDQCLQQQDVSCQYN